MGKEEIEKRIEALVMQYRQMEAAINAATVQLHETRGKIAALRELLNNFEKLEQPGEQKA